MLRSLTTLVLGFALYPLLFVPLMMMYAPDTLANWLRIYTDYLKLWGM